GASAIPGCVADRGYQPQPRYDVTRYFSQIDFERKNMSLTEQSVVLPSGIILRYVEQGPAVAMPVILLHGFPDSWLSWEPVLAHLPPAMRAIAVSLRGFGNSDKPATGYHPRELAADLADFMSLREIPHAVVAGHSMGALVAQSFAIEYPERVAGLAL